MIYTIHEIKESLKTAKKIYVEISVKKFTKNMTTDNRTIVEVKKKEFLEDLKYHDKDATLNVVWVDRGTKAIISLED